MTFYHENSFSSLLPMRNLKTKNLHISKRNTKNIVIFLKDHWFVCGVHCVNVVYPMLAPIASVHVVCTVVG